MKRGLVVYESLFGSSQQIARAIAAGLSDSIPSNAVEVGEATTLIGPDVGLLVVGGPNHATGMTSPATRKNAALKWDRPIVSTRRGLREWFDQLSPAPPGSRAVAFDTRLNHPRFLAWIDHASRAEESRLRAHGFELVAPAAHFLVQDPHGSLVDGEEQRARRWGQLLGGLCLPQHSHDGAGASEVDRPS